MKRQAILLSTMVVLLFGLDYTRGDITQYSIQAIDFRVQGLNDSAVVVGMATFGCPPILWQNGLQQTLSIPAGNYVYHYALNNGGQVVGDSGYRAFSWQNGELTYIAPANSSAQAVNNHGQVVGYYGIVERGFIWDAGHGFMDLGDLGGDRTLAYAINDNGLVVGQSGYNSAFLWQNGIMTDLAFHDRPRAINNSGQIVGGGYGSFIWDNGNLTYFGGSSGTARAINDLGQVVGYSDSTTEGFAYIWENGTMKDLNLFLPVNSGWYLVSALDINSSGQILGEGYFDGQWSGFLMTPVPAPGALLLGTIGLSFSGWLLRRRRTL
jgi:probable HAF family extracellular repeat protein